MLSSSLKSSPPSSSPDLLDHQSWRPAGGHSPNWFRDLDVGRDLSTDLADSGRHVDLLVLLSLPPFLMKRLGPPKQHTPGCTTPLVLLGHGSDWIWIEALRGTKQKREKKKKNVKIRRMKIYKGYRFKKDRHGKISERPLPERSTLPDPIYSSLMDHVKNTDLSNFFEWIR